MDASLDVVQLITSESPMLTSQEPMFSDVPILATTSIPLSCGMGENSCSMTTMDTSQLLQSVANQTDIVTGNFLLPLVEKIAEDVVEQTALIANDIVPVLIDIVAQVAEENILKSLIVEKQTLTEVIKKSMFIMLEVQLTTLLT